MITMKKDRTGSWRLVRTSSNVQLRLPFPGYDLILSSSPHIRRQSQEANVPNFVHSHGTEVNHAVLPL